MKIKHNSSWLPKSSCSSKVVWHVSRNINRRRFSTAVERVANKYDSGVPKQRQVGFIPPLSGHVHNRRCGRKLAWCVPWQRRCGRMPRMRCWAANHIKWLTIRNYRTTSHWKGYWFSTRCSTFWIESVAGHQDASIFACNRFDIWKCLILFIHDYFVIWYNFRLCGCDGNIIRLSVFKISHKTQIILSRLILIFKI